MEQMLLSAAEYGNDEAFRSIIDGGRVPDVSDEEGSTPLMYAAANGRESLVRLLLQNGVDVNRQNLYGWSALMQAAYYGHLPSIILLLQSGAEPNLINKWGASALVGAAQGGFLTVVQVLLKQGAKVASSEVASSLTPLMAASQCGHEDVVSELVRGGGNVNTKLKATGWTALMLAVLNNFPSMVELLLRHGADRHITDINGKTAADFATSLGHNDIVALLAGEKPKTFSVGDMFDSVKTGNVEKVQELLAYKPDFIHIKDKDGATPLIFAANKGHKKICEVLLKAGADTDVKDKVHGWTALMQATHQRNYDVVKLLGEYGAQVDIRGNTGSTAFDIANMIGDVEMIRIVANINIQAIQRKKSVPLVVPLPTPTPTPTPSSHTTTGELNSISETDELTSPSQMESPDRNKENGLGERGHPLDFTELAKRLRDAYRTPDHPSLTISTDDQKQGKDEPSFPLAPGRVRSNPCLFAADSASSSPSSSPSADKIPSRPQRRSRPDKNFLPRPASQPNALSMFLSKSSSGEKEKPSNLQLRGPLSKHPIVSPQNSSRFMHRVGKSGRDGEMPSFLQKYGNSRTPMFSPVRGRDSPSTFMRTPGQRSFDFEAKRPGMRERSYTDPVGRTPPSFRKRTPINPPSIDLKDVLKQASLGKYYSLFVAQEVDDYQSFVSLTANDLEELGISDGEDQGKLLALMSQLSSGTQTAGTPQTPVFVFQ